MANGDRIRQARKINRLTQTRLSALTGLTQAVISRYESGQVQPPLEAIERIALATDFPLNFFRRPSGPEISQGSLAFRARRYASTKLDLDQAQAWTELLYECCTGLAQRVEGLPAIRIPRLNGEPPRQAAQIARSALGFSPDRPIPNVTYALERAGVVVLALPVDLRGRDAFSTWAGDSPRVPIIVVPKNGTADARFWLAHELKHLMDYAPVGYIKEAEDAADAFAAEFLTPEAGIRDELASPISLELLAHLSRRWGVTRQSIVMRTVELHVISERRGQQLFRLLNGEPGRAMQTGRHEKPRVLKKMAEVLYGTPPPPQKLAADYDVPLSFATQMLDAHASRSEMVSVVAPDRDTDNVIPFRPTKG